MYWERKGQHQTSWFFLHSLFSLSLSELRAAPAAPAACPTSKPSCRHRQLCTQNVLTVNVLLSWCGVKGPGPTPAGTHGHSHAGLLFPLGGSSWLTPSGAEGCGGITALEEELPPHRLHAGSLCGARLHPAQCLQRKPHTADMSYLKKKYLAIYFFSTAGAGISPNFSSLTHASHEA